jgi:hypothetical protein
VEAAFKLFSSVELRRKKRFERIAITAQNWVCMIRVFHAIWHSPRKSTCHWERGNEGLKRPLQASQRRRRYCSADYSSPLSKEETYEAHRS